MGERAPLFPHLDRSDIPRTERTAQLLEAIARNIHEIECVLGEKDGSTNEPKRWHENIDAWAAVREMLYHGPVVEVATGDAFRDAKLDRLTELAASIATEKAQLIMGLRALGIEADLARHTETLGDLFRGPPITTNRDKLRAKAETMDDLNDHQRNYAAAMIDRLEQLDAEEYDNEEARAEAVEYLREGIEKGRATYSRPPRNPALDHALNLLWRAEIRPGALLPPLGTLATMPGSRTGPRLQPRKSIAGTISGALDAFGGAVKPDNDSGPTPDDAG